MRLHFRRCWISFPWLLLTFWEEIMFCDFFIYIYNLSLWRYVPASESNYLLFKSKEQKYKRISIGKIGDLFFLNLVKNAYVNKWLVCKENFFNSEITHLSSLLRTNSSRLWEAGNHMKLVKFFYLFIF